MPIFQVYILHVAKLLIEHQENHVQTLAAELSQNCKAVIT